MASLWSSREHAQAFLGEAAPDCVAALDQLFELLDDCASRLFESSSLFATTTALLTIKARNLAHGLYSMALDSLGQEAGALLRPLVEAIEMLEYLVEDPSRTDAVLDRKPSAGHVAKAINGDMKPLREYLNDQASHLSFGVHALEHCVDLSDSSEVRLRAQQQFRPAVVLTNLQVLLGFGGWLAAAAVACLVVATGHDQPELAARVDVLREDGMRAFDRALGNAGGA